MPPKRPHSPSADASDRVSKRQATETIVVDDDDDDLADILAQIKQHEESEALARRLQQEWNDSLSSASGSDGSSTTSEQQSVVSREDDEAFAKRLAAQWAEEDSVGVASAAPASTSRMDKGKARAVAAPLVRRDVSRDDAAQEAPTQRLRQYEDFFIGSKNCTECSHELLSPRGYRHIRLSTRPRGLLHVHCPSCETTFCRGCLQLVPCTASCKGNGKDKGRECPVLTCCTEARAIALFEALGGFDRHCVSERATSDERAKAAMSQYRKNHTTTVGPGGTGYSTGSTSGGYHGDYYGTSSGRGRRSNQLQKIPSRLQDLSTHADAIVVRALSTITSLLPSPYSDSPKNYDIIPHASVAWLIQCSQIPELLGTLLRNDSVTDWTLRSDVYNAMLSLLRRMSDCELTLEVLIGQRYELEKSGGIEEWMWGDADIVWAKADGKLAEANPLYTHFQKLTKQCEAFLAGASQMLEGDEAPADEVESLIKSTSLCGEIVAARDDLERTMKAIGRDPPTVAETPLAAVSQNSEGNARGKGNNAETAADLERQYSHESERLAFQHIAFPQNQGQYTMFNYAGLIASTAGSTRNPKDRLHLIRELAVMATSLPPGVWVRVDEVRNDALKIMIAGPEGTPYAGGLFEFDCFLPLEYPHKPPLVHLRTTGNGSVRFNPNLYSNGKVCLSLLGTWPGPPEEQWSAKSTILQVAVSIQSMILIDLPYFNEPGFGKANAAHMESIRYNKNITIQTVRWAMMEWFKDEHKTSIWADVIKTHFTLRADIIRARIHAWAAQEPQLRAYRAPYTNLSPFGSQQHIHSFQDYLTPRSEPSPLANGSTLNLLEEFDRGINKLKTWEIDT